jgi:RNA polymerase sigma-70 factor, ECF subfamily
MPTDRELVALAKRGDSEAFGQLYLRHKGRVTRLCGRFTREPEDLAQEAFVNAYKALPRFKGKCEFGTWLYRIAVNLGLMSRRRPRRVWAEGDLDEAFTLDLFQSPEPSFELNPDSALVWRAMGGISPACQGVVAMRYVRGMTDREISNDTGVPLSTVKSRVARGRGQFRERYLELAR